MLTNKFKITLIVVLMIALWVGLFINQVMLQGSIQNLYIGESNQLALDQRIVKMLAPTPTPTIVVKTPVKVVKPVVTKTATGSAK